MATTQIIAEPGSQQIEILTEFDAPRALLFRAHTDPQLLVQWLGPREYTMTIDHLNVRDGGTYRYIHEDADGNEFGGHGVFHGTPSVDGIVQTFEYEGMPGRVALEKATFEEQGGKTILRQVAVYQSVEDRDAMIDSGMERGVRDSMDRLEALLRQLAPVS